MRLPIPRRARRSLLVLCFAAAPLVAQDTTTRGVRIGLTYDPGTKPGVVVLPVSGAGGDSVRAIVARDFDFGDRINVIQLDPGASTSALRGGVPNWGLLAQLGAAAAVQVTPTATGLHVAVFNVGTKQTALIRDYPTPADVGTRARGAGRCMAWPTISRSRSPARAAWRTRASLFERGRRLWICRQRR